jgi:predicted transcriptional regulator
MQLLIKRAVAVEAYKNIKAIRGEVAKIEGREIEDKEIDIVKAITDLIESCKAEGKPYSVSYNLLKDSVVLNLSDEFVSEFINLYGTHFIKFLPVLKNLYDLTESAKVDYEEFYKKYNLFQ